MKHGKKTFVIIEAVLGILVILVLGFIIYKQNGHEPETIAVIIPDVDESEWSAFKYGLKMAAREYDTDVVIISKDNMETANEEIEIMNQEIAKGADAVIVKPIANRDGQQKLKQLEKSVPIMAVGDTFPEEPSGLHTIASGKLPWKSDREEDWDLFAACHFRSSDKKNEGDLRYIKGEWRRNFMVCIKRK